MKVIYVDNQFDTVSTGKREEVRIMLLERGFTGEFHVADFMAVRESLPISVAPCVLILLDDLTGDFDPAAVVEVLQKVGVPLAQAPVR